MRWRWLQLGYVHAQLPLTAQQRREVDKLANMHAGRRWSFRVKLAAVSLALPVGVIGGGFIATGYLIHIMPAYDWAAAIGYLAACGLSVWIYCRVVWGWYRKPTRLALRDLGHDICVHCGYWLRELRDDVQSCPECGAKREAVPVQSQEKPES